MNLPLPGDRLLLGTAVLAAIVFLLIPTVGTGFLGDDFLDLDHEFSAASFTRFAFIGFRPLTEAIYALDAHVWGERNAWGWHITNLLIHASCTLLFWRVALQLSRSGRAAALAAALFVVSFATVPAFARVSGRTTSLSMIPFLAAVLAHCRWTSDGKPRNLLLGLVLFLAALFAKETVLLCAPVFGLVTVHLESRGQTRPRDFLRVTALYLIPTALYLAWRFSWFGFALGYSDSASLGPFMLGNLLELARMAVSPWLDGVPLRLLLILALTVLLLVRVPWRTRLLVIALIALPITTVSNLPPRNYYAYAALPGVALLFGMAAGSLRGRSGRVLLPVFLLGCFLSARDEVSRYLQADAYTSRTILLLDSLRTSCTEESLVFIRGIEYGVAGYSTFWPGAFSAPLSTLGSDGSRLFDESMLWEACWPVIQGGGHPSCVFARLSETGFDTLHFDPSARFPPEALSDTLLSSTHRRIGITADLWRMGSCSMRGTGRILISDPFDPELWVQIVPDTVRGDTTFFDLESSVDWLLADTSGGGCLLLPEGDGVVSFSGARLWQGPLEATLARKSVLSRQRTGHP